MNNDELLVMSQVLLLLEALIWQLQKMTAQATGILKTEGTIEVVKSDLLFLNAIPQRIYSGLDQILSIR